MPTIHHRDAYCLCPNCLSPDQTHSVPFGGGGAGHVTCNNCGHSIGNVDIIGGQAYGPMNPRMKIVRGEHQLGVAPLPPSVPPLVVARQRRAEALAAAAQEAERERLRKEGFTLLDISHIPEEEKHPEDDWDSI